MHRKRSIGLVVLVLASLVLGGDLILPRLRHASAALPLAERVHSVLLASTSAPAIERLPGPTAQSTLPLDPVIQPSRTALDTPTPAQEARPSSATLAAPTPMPESPPQDVTQSTPFPTEESPHSRALESAPTKPGAPSAAAQSASAPTPGSTPTPTHAISTQRRVATHVPYCDPSTGADPHMRHLTIDAPARAHGLPVIIYVHGGGWASGDCSQTGAKPDYFTNAGFVLVSVNYRLLPTSPPTEQAADLATAVAWVHAHIAEYGGDGSRLFLLGHSAGAHLSALVATDETFLRAAGLDLTALKGVILLDSAAYDVEQLMRSATGKEAMYQTAFGNVPGAWAAVSPRAHVAPGRGIAPCLLLLATATGQRRPGAEGLAAALRAAGVYAQVADATAFRDHGTIDSELGRAGDPPTAAVKAFLDMLLAGPPHGLGGQVVLRPAP